MQLESHIMDTYALGRMLRTFHKTPRDDPQNIIIYAGEGHAMHYEQFFEWIGSRTVLAVANDREAHYVSFSPYDKKSSFLFANL